MRFGRTLAAMAAVTLASAPAMAAPANPAASLSLAGNARVGSSAKHKDDLLGGGLIVAIIAAAAVVVGVVVVADNSNNGTATSR